PGAIYRQPLRIVQLCTSSGATISAVTTSGCDPCDSSDDSRNRINSPNDIIIVIAEIEIASAVQRCCEGAIELGARPWSTIPAIARRSRNPCNRCDSVGTCADLSDIIVPSIRNI